MSEVNGLIDHISDFIGETVTIYTTSGGESGCGFTGVCIKANGCFIRLVTRFGSAPSCALSNGCVCSPRLSDCRNRCFSPGSVVDIPVDRIVAFVHNAV